MSGTSPATTLSSSLPVARGLGREQEIAWPLRPSGDLFELRYGKALKESVRRPGSVPVYGSNGQTGTHDTALFSGPGVILGRKGMGHLGVEWSSGDYWVIDTAYSLAPLTDIDLRFAYYLVRHVGLDHLKHGTSNPSLTREAFAAQLFPVPPPSEQRAIAEVLVALDDKIAANQIAAAKADDLIAAYYQWAISQPDATARPLLDVVDVTYGEAFRGTYFSDAGVGRPLIRIRDLKTSSPQVWTTESRPRETVIQPGDVVVGMDAEFRASWWLGEPGLLNQRVLRAKAKIGGTAFVRECLRRPLAAIENQKSATTVVHLNKSDLERSEVHVPGAEALAQFDAAAEPTRLARVALARESKKLAATRDELLPLLMSGKIRVKGAEKSLEGVL